MALEVHCIPLTVCLPFKTKGNTGAFVEILERSDTWASDERSGMGLPVIHDFGHQIAAPDVWSEPGDALRIIRQGDGHTFIGPIDVY